MVDESLWMEMACGVHIIQCTKFLSLFQFRSEVKCGV